MSRHELQSYSFEGSRQWGAGLSTLLDTTDAGLAAASRLTLVALPRTGLQDATAALTHDACGTVHWVRDETFELVRALDTGPLVVTCLTVSDGPEVWRPDTLIMERENLWLLVRSRQDASHARLIRYDAENPERMRTFEVEHSLLAACGDGRGGVWMLLGGNHAAELRRIDAAGECHPKTITFEKTKLTSAVLRATAGRRTLIVLDCEPQLERDDSPISWRVWSVDVCGKDKPSEIYSWPAGSLSPKGQSRFHPDLLALDSADRLYLAANRTGELWVLNEAGQLLAHHADAIGSAWLPLTAIDAHDEPIVAGQRGIARVQTASVAQQSAPKALPTFITPVLVSPEGENRGWLRADLDVELKGDSAIEVSVATTRDESLVDELRTLARNPRVPPSERLRLLQMRLPWMEGYTKVYRGSEMRGPLRFPLYEIDAPYLWLRVRIHAADTEPPPRISRLRVLYPNVSYTRYLPATYQEDSNAAKFLRRFLAIFESVFGDLDAELAELPRRIHPDTAADDWSGFLLSWLGFPVHAGLSAEQRLNLLRAAPDLLRERGTLGALIRLLGLLVGPREFAVSDAGSGPGPWPLGKSRGGYVSRLGRDTLVLRPCPNGFRLGSEARLGDKPLGIAPRDSASLFARRSGAVEIRVAASGKRMEDLEPLLRFYLPHFIPAHCRHRLHFVSHDRLGRTPVIDDGLRVHPEPVARLGDSARLGRLRVTGRSEGVILGRADRLGRGLYLA